MKYYVHIFLSKKDGKDQESIQSSTTPDPGYQWEVTTSQYQIKSNKFIQHNTLTMFIAYKQNKHENITYRHIYTT